jgi:CRISPR/Cas system CSM-associated protein Csm3 (group 7 of RAMP superfamily)
MRVTFLVFQLRFTEPGGVTVPGYPDPDPDPDAQPERDGAHVLLDTGPDGKPQLPGTSLTGALRELVRAQRDDQTAGDWFGQLLEPGTGDMVDAQASRIWVLGSRPYGDLAPAEFYASTKINRHRGAADARTLRIEEVLPAGSTFEVFLRWDDAAPSDIEDFASLLAAWRPLLGRGVSRGRGRCVTAGVRHGTLHLDQPADLLRWLTGTGPELARDVAVTPVEAAAGSDAEPVIRVPVSIAGPWRIGSGQTPASREPIPVLKVRGQYLVPGSALKGVLRSRAEFILRSTGMTPPPCDIQPCGQCWTCEVFGHGGGRDQAARTVGARAVIRVPDVTVTDPLPIERTHVAIDRFTGGALPGALYTFQALEAGTFPITVEAAAVLDPRRQAEIGAVLRLVLEDLHDGLIGMGGGTARGYGSVTVDFGRSAGLPSLPEARGVLATMVRGDERAAS